MVQLSQGEQLAHETATPDMLGSIAELSRNTDIANAVFGAPVDRDGVTVIPVARLARGGGGGGGSEAGEASGAGGGFGVAARPVGAFVIRDGKVSWRPALDLNRVITGGQVVAVVALLTVRAIVRARRRRRRTA